MVNRLDSRDGCPTGWGGQTLFSMSISEIIIFLAFFIEIYYSQTPITLGEIEVNYFRMVKSSRHKLVFLLFAIAFLTFISWHSPTTLSAEDSSCVSCHTDAKKLIEITRAIEAAKLKAGHQPVVESEGEG